MSISKFQNVIKGGCGQVVMVGMAAVFIAGLAYQGCGAGMRGGLGGNGGAAATEVAQVGGVGISADAIGTAVEQQMQQFGGATTSLPPSFEILLMGQALQKEIEKANGVALAKQNGIDLSDGAILKYIDGQLAEIPKIAREQLVQAGRLKPNATEAELDAAVKAAVGKPLGEYLKDQRREAAAALTDPKKAPAIVAGVAQAALLDQYKKKLTVSDDELRRSFDVAQFKRIVVAFKGATPGGLAPTNAVMLDETAARQKADQALQAVRGGKSFEEAMIAYSGEPAQGPGKKVSDNVLPIPPEQLDTPEYAALKALKVGDVSEVQKTPEGFVISKNVGVKAELPKDFATKTSTYRDALVDRRAKAALTDDLKKYGEANAPKFSSEAYGALYAFTKLSAPPSGAAPNAAPPTPTEAQLREVIDQAKRVDKAAPDFRIASIVRRAAFDRLYEQAKDKAPLAEERIETILASVEAKDDFDGRIELVDAYLGQRKYKEAGEQLAAASRANTTYDAQGQTRFGTIASKLVALKKDGQLPADAEQQILGEQDRWRSEKTASDTAQAEAAKLQAQDAAQKAAQEKANRPKAKVQDVPPKK